MADESPIRDVKALLREEIVLAFLCLVFLFGGIFGAVNWNSYCHPAVPKKGIFGMSEERYAIATMEYERKMAEVGKDASIPWSVAVPLCLVGMVGAAGFGVAFLEKVGAFR